jgi:hypothetical protein
MQNIMGGRVSPFRGASGGASGFLSRSGSTSKDSRNKRNSQTLDREDSCNDTVMFASKPNNAASAQQRRSGGIGTIATASLKTTPFPPVLSPVLTQFESTDKTLGSPMIIVQSLSTSDPPLGITSPAGGVSSSTSTTSTLSVEIDDEDLISTRSPSPFEDMMDSQATMSSGTEPVSEDLPEALRLMRVAQRHGIKVVDFAFEGAKRHGVVEDWAWEGGAACKGFGIGFGGGAYNGVLKKYRPPPKEMPEDPEEDDRMVVDKANYHQNVFTSKPPPHRPAPIFSGAGTGNGRPMERPLNSPGLPRPAPGLSGSDFMKYLEERRASQSVAASVQPPTFASSSDIGFKRDRSFVSSEPHPDDCGPFKRRVLG